MPQVRRGIFAYLSINMKGSNSIGHIYIGILLHLETIQYPAWLSKLLKNILYNSSGSSKVLTEHLSMLR